MKETERLGQTLAGYRVLVVEDEVVNQLVVRRLLAQMGASALMAGTLAEAQALLQHTSFDAALIDLHLPDGSGADLIAALRQSGMTRVIGMTACEVKPGDALLRQKGFAALISKPVTASALLSAIEQGCTEVPDLNNTIASGEVDQTDPDHWPAALVPCVDAYAIQDWRGMAAQVSALLTTLNAHQSHAARYRQLQALQRSLARSPPITARVAILLQILTSVAVDQQ